MYTPRPSKLQKDVSFGNQSNGGNTKTTVSKHVNQTGVRTNVLLSTIVENM
jgi:hypothetical protein